MSFRVICDECKENIPLFPYAIDFPEEQLRIISTCLVDGKGIQRQFCKKCLITILKRFLEIKDESKNSG